MTFDVIPSTPRLAPELAEGHLVLGYFFEDGALDFTRAHEAFERALALAPGDATVLRLSGDFLVSMGRQFDEGISAARRAVALDPVNRSSHLVLGAGLYFARRYREAIQAYADIITLDPAVQESYGVRGLAYYGLDDLKNARSSCESKPDHWAAQWSGSGIRQDWTAHRRGAEPRFQAIERQLKFPS
jgi:tetratricopeptide (TPR) repeat protein